MVKSSVIELNYKEFQNKVISILKSFHFRREEGIRTLDTLLGYTHFPGVRLRPLGHLSIEYPYFKPVSYKARANNEKNIILKNLCPDIYCISPLSGVSNTVLKSVSLTLFPKRYISFAMAASVVMSLPLMIPSFLSCSLVSYSPM